MSRTENDVYLSGTRLYGDDFSPEQISAWFSDEAEASVDMAGIMPDGDRSLEALNTLLTFRYLPTAGAFRHALSFGGARGSEMLTLNGRIEKLYILESTLKYDPDSELQMHVEYLSARPDGKINLSDESLDLVVCFGALHHIPNVTAIVNEFARLTNRDGWLALREPINSMGDWRQPRNGLTKHERGIPLHILRDIVSKAGFEIVREKLHGCPPVLRMHRYSKYNPYSSNVLTKIDSVFARALLFNYRYHSASNWQKVRPTSVALLARRT